MEVIPLGLVMLDPPLTSQKSHFNPLQKFPKLFAPPPKKK